MFWIIAVLLAGLMLLVLLEVARQLFVALFRVAIALVLATVAFFLLAEIEVEPALALVSFVGIFGLVIAALWKVSGPVGGVPVEVRERLTETKDESLQDVLSPPAHDSYWERAIALMPEYRDSLAEACATIARLRERSERDNSSEAVLQRIAFVDRHGNAIVDEAEAEVGLHSGESERQFKLEVLSQLLRLGKAANEVLETERTAASDKRAARNLYFDSALGSDTPSELNLDEPDHPMQKGRPFVGAALRIFLRRGNSGRND